MTKTKTESKQFPLRIKDLPLYKRIAKSAKDNGRSVNAEIIQAIKKYLK